MHPAFSQALLGPVTVHPSPSYVYWAYRKSVRLNQQCSFVTKQGDTSTKTEQRADVISQRRHQGKERVLEQ